MKRIKLVLATVAAMAVMMVAASPALAHHGWWFSDWWRWDDTRWWCYTGWEHEEDGWDFEFIACWHPDHGWWIG